MNGYDIVTTFPDGTQISVFTRFDTEKFYCIHDAGSTNVEEMIELPCNERTYRYIGMTESKELEFLCVQSGVILNISPRIDSTRKCINIYEILDPDKISSGDAAATRVAWFNIISIPFDLSFFMVGHPYIVTRDDTRKGAYMLLKHISYESLEFVYVDDHGEIMPYTVTSKRYANMKKSYWFTPIIHDDCWSDTTKEVAEEDISCQNL